MAEGGHGGNGDDPVALGRLLERTAEPGFFEQRTHEALAAAFRGRGFIIEDFPGMPGFAVTLDGKNVAVVADMDGLPSGGRGEGDRTRYANRY